MASEFVRLKLGKHFDEHLAELVQAIPGKRDSISEDISGDAIRKKRIYLKRRYPELHTEALRRAESAASKLA